MMNRYPVGNIVRLRGAFKNIDGALADPDVVKCSVKCSLGQKTTYSVPEVVKDSTGNYHLDVSADTIGSWSYRWFSSGGVKAACSSSFFVIP